MRSVISKMFLHLICHFITNELSFLLILWSKSSIRSSISSIPTLMRIISSKTFASFFSCSGTVKQLSVDDGWTMRVFVYAYMLTRFFGILRPSIIENALSLLPTLTVMIAPNPLCSTLSAVSCQSLLSSPG